MLIGYARVSTQEQDTQAQISGVRLGNGQYCTVSLFFEQAKSSQ